MFVYVFKTYIYFGVRHDSRTLFIGAGRDACAMFGLLEPGVVLGLVACGIDLCMLLCLGV